MKQEDENRTQKESVEDILAELNELLNRMPAILADIRIPDSPPPGFPAAGDVPAFPPSQETAGQTGEAFPQWQAPAAVPVIPEKAEPVLESPAVEEIEIEGKIELPAGTPAAALPDMVVPELTPHAEPVIEPVLAPAPAESVSGIVTGEESLPPAQAEEEISPLPVEEPKPVLESEAGSGPHPQEEVPADVPVSGSRPVFEPPQEAAATASVPGIERFPSEISNPAASEGPAAPVSEEKPSFPGTGQDQPPREEKTLIIEPSQASVLEIEKPPQATAGPVSAAEEKTLIIAPEEETTVVLSPETTQRAVSGAAGSEMFEKGVPAGMPDDQVKGLGFIYAQGDEGLCAGFLSMLDDVCGKSKKRPIFIKRAFVRQFEEGMNGAAAVDAASESSAIGIVCVGNIPEQYMRDMDKALMGSGVLFKYISADEAPQRACAVDLIAEIMLR